MASCLLRSLLKPFGDADMSIGITEFGPDWKKVGGTSFVIKHCFFNPHDFAVTAKHHIFFQVAFRSSHPSMHSLFLLTHKALNGTWTPLRLHVRGFRMELNCKHLSAMLMLLDHRLLDVDSCLRIKCACCRTSWILTCFHIWAA